MRLITTAIILATSLILACSSTDNGKSKDSNDLDTTTTGSDGDQDITSSDEGTGGTGGNSDVTEDSDGSGSTGADGETPLTCCDSDSDCDADHVCLLEEKVCRSEAELSAGKCWTDQHCAGDSKCQGVSVCPCEQRCENIIEVVGTCSSVAPPTCQTLDPNSFGPCEAVLGIVFDGQNCVTASGCDCGSDCDAFYDTIEACEEACGAKDKCADFVPPGCVQSGCPEGQTCDTNAGDCVPSACSCDPETGEVICTADCGGGVCVASVQPGNCCTPPDSCEPGLTCVKGPNACKDSKTLDKGQCWSNENCAPGSQCAEVNVCPCDAQCDMVDSPGKCVDKIVPLPVCAPIDPNSFGDCEKIIGVVFDGQHCVTASGCGCGNQCNNIFETIDECEKTCSSPNKCAGFESPACIDKGCKTGLVCDTTVGCVPSTCDCDAATGDIVCTDDCGGGTCVPKDGDTSKCCGSDKDCLDAEICAQGVCKKDAKPYCWSSTQCKPGSLCQFVKICPCGQNCITEDKPGKCSSGPIVPVGCKSLKADEFGACEMILGWAWTGTKCEQLSGCGCEPVCDMFFSSQLECMKNCSFPMPQPAP